MLDWCRITVSCYRARGGKPALTLPCPAPPKPGVIHHAAINFWPFWGWEKNHILINKLLVKKTYLILITAFG